jgi:threonine/homoserine/homoserine lactone efflux protein
MLTYLLKGIIIGVSVAAPVGPIGILCINRTLSGGFWTGFVSGLGAASADLIYGGITAAGFAAASALLLKVQVPVRLAGLLFIAYLGIMNLVRRKPAAEEAGQRDQGRRRGLAAYASTLALTLTNPLTILFFAGVIAAGGGPQAGSGTVPAFMLVCGVFLGSAAWWLTLAGVTALLRTRLSPRVTSLINRLSGAALLGFAALLAVGFIRAIRGG